MRCSCKKNGLKCVDACGDCRGVACSNVDCTEQRLENVNDDENFNV
jgi:hypothetical protein